MCKTSLRHPRTGRAARSLADTARGGTVFHVTPEQWDTLVDRVGGLPLARAAGQQPVHFVPRQHYRRAALHDCYGGQRQGGISTPAQSPIILLFSSPRGADFGYRDGQTSEGLYLYTGEGQRDARPRPSGGC